MESHVTAYAKGHVISKVKQMVKELDEYRNASQKLEAVQREYYVLKNGFESQAQELKMQTRNPTEFRRKLGDLQRKASEPLKLKELGILEIQASLKKTERQLFVQVLHQQVEDEVRTSHTILNEFGLEGARHGDLTVHGRLGLGIVLSLYFKADKNALKAIKKKFEGTPFKKIDLFIGEAGYT